MKLQNLLAATLLLIAAQARADGLADLKAALSRLQGQAPVKGHVSVKSESKSSDGDEAEANTGAAQIQFEDGPQGLRLTYPAQALVKATQEEATKDGNPKANTPTATGLKSLAFSEVRELARAAEVFQRELANATLKGERTDTYQGQAARVLTLDIPQKKADKYVKKFESVVDVWIAADGTPLAAKARQQISGRAFMVITFEMTNSEEMVFNVVGDRLVAVRRVTTNSGQGAGQKGQGRREYSLQLT